MCSSRVPARAVPHVLPTSVEVDGHRNTRGFGERQQALQGGRGEVLVKPRTPRLECKFIPAAVYWQKEGQSLLLLGIIPVLPCQSFARGGSAWRTFPGAAVLCLPSTETTSLFQKCFVCLSKALRCPEDPGV